MKIYFAGEGHDIEKTLFIENYKQQNWLLSYGGLNKNRFFWIIGNKVNLPKYIIQLLIKNYENLLSN